KFTNLNFSPFLSSLFQGKDAPVDPWEDSNFRLYKVVDRFGFVHETELPSYDSVEEKQKHTEVERTTKWLKMLKNWDKYKNSEKVILLLTALISL
uniref:Uncharacterized protein n=1 Tax=Maylandia zebra TaxID=106582 RepID=A0A3P9D349_9CICH